MNYIGLDHLENTQTGLRLFVSDFIDAVKLYPFDRVRPVSEASWVVIQSES
jgi:hypothetical protein